MDFTWKHEVSAFLTQAEAPLLVVLGPTAGGKTAFSIEMAKYVQESCGKAVEIINADSRQLYRHLRIGTAKITPEEMQGVPHHLLDVLDPNEEATAGWYQREATACITDIHTRGAVPMMVGGSMLYMSAVIDGLSMPPGADSALRQKLLEEYDNDNGHTLYQKLLDIDPEAAEVIHQNNRPRLVRAIEIYELLSLPKSQAVPHTELRKEGESAYDLCIFGMQWEREALYERINARTNAMFEAGWIEEVEDILKKDYSAQDPAFKSHGYREIIAFMEGSLDDIDALKELIAAKSRQYAKRQQSWWKRDSRIHWVTPETQR